MKLLPLRRPDNWHGPWRWRPGKGEPRCLAEQVAQYVWTHALGLYIALGVTLTVLLQVYWHPRG